MENSEKSFKEKRIRDILFMYYSRPDVRKALYEFSKNRECTPRYFEGFGKRPDSFQYESDITEQVRKGATSFHCSEELWQDPLEISTEMNRKELDGLRVGWDLLLDIDSPYLEYSKIYAELLIQVLKLHNVENVGIKFSGSKGFHIIIPWKSFPEELYNQKTKNMFPEWPRIICEYLSEAIQPKLTDRILQEYSLKEIAERTGKKEEDLIVRECKLCNRPATKKFFITWTCQFCKTEITVPEGHYNNRKKSKCPNCRKDLIEKSREIVYSCEFCEINSKRNPEKFEKKERFATEKLIEADLILVASRHLFRMPYSLHEKTSLASIVLDKEKIKDFQISEAKPLRVEVKNFYPESEKGEAKNLLLAALDWKEQKDQEEKSLSEFKTAEPLEKIPKKDFQKVEIPNPPEDIFPPCIKIILRGLKQDGRKRALFILINFLKSLGISDNELETRINDWNEKNEYPLKKGYIQAQLQWYKRNSSRMPPNCDKTNYKDLAICKPDTLCKKIKNPINYAIRKYFSSNSKT